MSFNAYVMSVLLSCSFHIQMVHPVITEKLWGPSHGSIMIIQQKNFTNLV
jgi:hypothetical protein